MTETFRESCTGCFKDAGICCMTCFCPCIQIARNKANIDGRDCTICDCCCSGAICLEYFTRQQIRSKYNMDYSPATDCLCTCCFSSCIICQDAREMQVREREAGAPRGGQMGGGVHY